MEISIRANSKITRLLGLVCSGMQMIRVFIKDNLKMGGEMGKGY